MIWLETAVDRRIYTYYKGRKTPTGAVVRDSSRLAGWHAVTARRRELARTNWNWTSKKKGRRMRLLPKLQNFLLDAGQRNA